jgi:UDP-N-acetylglucosamine 4,6-dehydratase/5-epimerase
MKMKSCRILDLIRVLERRLAKSPVKVREIGIRPGEKLHEVLVSGYESEHTYHYKDHYFVILPASPQPRLLERYGHLPRVEFHQYDSSSVLISLDEIEEMLGRGGMLD